MVDFRSDRMESPEGRGLARRAWEAYVGGVRKVSDPALRGSESAQPARHPDLPR